MSFLPKNPLLALLLRPPLALDSLGGAIDSLVGFFNARFITISTSFGSATIMPLSVLNRKLSALTSSAYRLMLYGSFWPLSTFLRDQVMMNGPVDVTIVVSSMLGPVLNFAAVKAIGVLVSCWNCATCSGLSASRRGCGLLSFGKATSKPSLPSFLPA